MGNSNTHFEEYKKCDRIINMKEIGVCDAKYYRPVTGFKSVYCDDVDDKVNKSIATVNINPAYGVKIVRPKYDDTVPANFMRTNEYTITNFDIPAKKYYSWFMPSYEYELNNSYQSVVDDDVTHVCARGLHFVLTKEDAAVH